MALAVRYLATCDGCRAYGGDAPTRRQLGEKLTKNGWFSIDGKLLCGRHREYEPGTAVTVAAGVNPIGQGKTYQGFLHLAGTNGSIWQCGHQHRQKRNGDPAAAFECAREYALSRGYIITPVAA